MLYVEKFVLVEHISAGCGYSIRKEINYFDFNSCIRDVDGLTIFNNNNDSCDEKYETDSIQFTCYELAVTPTENDMQTTIYS